MPTPVTVARQCLTDEAARALDEAVAVARRRSHAQTSSLHAVSALLALPSSTLREACSRATACRFSSRRQFRALDLCVGVSLDRLPSAKIGEEDPPLSNSLMAAIKRSQANQRRHPDNFHMYQIHCNQQAPSVLKVELKHFILSILDDPIVSRVFGEAGYRNCDLKVAILHPPVTQTPKFSRAPPFLLGYLPGPEPGPSRPRFSFPFSAGFEVDGGVGVDDDSYRKIGEALMKRNDGKGKFLLLLGPGAGNALNGFVDCVNNDNKEVVLPSGVEELRVISIEKEVVEFVNEGDEENMGLKFEELRDELERCPGQGIVVNIGELKVLVGEIVCGGDALSFLVSKFTALLEGFREKLWLMGAAATYETYSKFVRRFLNVEKDWDLRILPITSYKSPVDGLGSKSSLMGSFVPFGGFFPAPSDFEVPSRSLNPSITLCHLCNAKYEEDVAAILKIGSTMSVADQHFENLPSWLQMTDLGRGKTGDAMKTKDDCTALSAKILGMQRKWNDTCQRLHHAPFLNFDLFKANSHASVTDGIPNIADRKESRSGSRDSSLHESEYANLSLGVHINGQKIFPTNCSISISVAPNPENVNGQSKLLEEVSKSQQKEKESPRLSVSLPTDGTSCSSVTSVTTDLGLGTLCASSAKETNAEKSCDPKEHLWHFSGSNSAELEENTSYQISISSSCSGPCPGGQFTVIDPKSVRRVLSEKVGWQDRAVCSISEVVSRCKAGHGRYHGSNVKGDIWLTFLGPDRIGKKKIASALAEVMFGGVQNLISVDLASHDRISSSNSIFKCEEFDDYDLKFARKNIVDYIASELRRKPCLVILLENVDKADVLVKDSLSRAMETGRFPDSLGREVSVNSTIFVATSTSSGNTNFLPEKEAIRFPEDRILGAKNWQMQILVERASEDANNGHEMNLTVSREVIPTAASVNKRKLDGTINDMEQEMRSGCSRRAQKSLRCHLDLNLPVEEMEDNVNYCDFDNDSSSESSQAWLKGFFDQVDEKVVFKPYDFDSLAKKIEKGIRTQFWMAFGTAVLLEIDHEVMVQILAASWLSDQKTAVEDWIEKVLGRGFWDAKQKFQISAHCVVKLVACNGLLVEEQAPGISLPLKVNLCN